MAETSFVVPGLVAPVSIDVDRWGIAHIRASGRSDLFLAQGFNVARDRLWQIDLWRKRGLGLLAADFGPGYLEQDRASRLFLYRGDMAAEWASYDGDAEGACRAFAAGINAYIALTEREPERLGPEFALMNTRPARWHPDDVVRIRSHALSRNAVSEVARANVMARAGAGVDVLRQRLDPAATAMAEPGVDLGAMPPGILELLQLATAPVSFTPDRLAASLSDAPHWRTLSALGDVEQDGSAQGSNNWAVAGRRTASGRPVLASDPHRAHTLPSLRYLVHLSMPGLDVIGAGEPILPGISLGHNGTAAFGLTIFPGPDQEDVYVYDTKPGAPHVYRYRGQWEEMRVETEAFAVNGHPDQARALKFTRHGPVIHEDLAARRAFAIRSVWFEPGSAPYLASLAAMAARSFGEFRHALRRWAVPTTNQAYADVAGDIGWVAAGLCPVRPNWTGLLPVPGDGRYEWSGFRTSEHLPWALNPSSGFVMSANEMNVPVEWSARERPVGYEWAEGSRARRLTEVLASAAPHSVAASCALQNDVVSDAARRLCGLLRDRRPVAAPPPAMGLLEPWNGALATGSAAAALFEVWWTKHLRPSVIARVTDDATVRELIGTGDVASVLDLLETPDARLGTEPDATRDALLGTTLAAAFRTCGASMGDDVAAWSWGRLHQAHFEHPLSRIEMVRTAAWDVGPLPQGGSGSTPMNASYRASDFRVTVGATVRLVIDVGDWDRSVCVNSPGQSGDPWSPHYADLASLWSTGAYVPLLYGAEAIERATEARIRLAPPRPTHESGAS